MNILSTYIRPWCYIYNSKIDFCDFWLSLLFVILGLQMSSFEPFDKIRYYEPTVSLGINPLFISLSFLFLGLTNLIKILFPKKPILSLDLTIKLLMFFLLVMMSLATMKYSVFHILSIFYGMSAAISASVIFRTS